jgi:hypothetical protein
MKLTALFVVLLLPSCAMAQSYKFEGLSTEDVLTIGRALDKLPREETDKNGLYGRLQQQITAQNKAREETNKAAFDEAVAKAAAAKSAPEDKHD